MHLNEPVEYLVCPTTRQPVTITDGNGDAMLALEPAPRTGRGPDAIGHTNQLLLRENGLAACPLVATLCEDQRLAYRPDRARRRLRR